jgi:hypothetical protein
VLKRNLPAGGGGYFRLLPYAVSRALLRRVNQVDARPGIFYFHPWEIDPAQPRVPGTGLKTRFATTSTCAGPSRGFGACCATSAGAGWTRSSSARKQPACLSCPPRHGALRELAPRIGVHARRSAAARADTVLVGPQHALKTPSAAATFARDGDVVEIEPGIYYGDAAIWTQTA